MKASIKSIQDSRHHLFATKNDLPEAIRLKVIELCNGRLADAIDLQTQCKHAHWNVKGATFIALHELFDKINEDVEDYVDLVAERAVQLGGVAEGTARMAVKRSGLAEFKATSASGPDQVEALAASLATFGKLARAAIDTTIELGDADTADIFTEISRGIDKWLWMLEAHLQVKG
jgi:starvation-inducible DNA-binding protein